MSDPQAESRRRLWERILDYLELKFRKDPVGSAFGLILGLWVGTAVFSRGLRTEVAGTFGDTFGTMNSLIGGLTLVGVGYAAWLQREALKDTRKALKDSESEREKSLELMAAQAVATQSAAELNALESLLQHYNQQIIFHHQRAIDSHVDDLVGTDPHVEEHRYIKLRDGALQLVRAKLAEVRTPDLQFNWGQIRHSSRGWSLRYCLTLLRETAARLYNDLVFDRESNFYLRTSVHSNLVALRNDLNILASQDGITGSFDHFIIISRLNLVRVVLRKIHELPQVEVQVKERLELWRRIDYLLDEHNIYAVDPEE